MKIVSWLSTGIHGERPMPTYRPDDRNQWAIAAGTSYRAAATINSGAAPQNNFLVVAGTWAKCYIDDITIHYEAANTRWEIYLNPATTTSGVLIPSVSKNQSRIIPATAQCFTAPAVTLLGSLIAVFHTQGAGQRSFTVRGLIRLAPNQKLLVRRVTTGGGNEIGFNIEWTEEVF